MKYMNAGATFSVDGVTYPYGTEYSEDELPEGYEKWFVPVIPPVYANKSKFPSIGVVGTDYTSKSDGRVYVWTGSEYAEKRSFSVTEAEDEPLVTNSDIRDLLSDINKKLDRIFRLMFLTYESKFDETPEE